MELVIATSNQAKAREFREMLGDDRFRWRDLREFPAVEEVPETAATFRGNACLKASGYALQLGAWALADDSGLEVDALGGKPGVHSARWAERHGAGRGDADNNALLLQQLRDVPVAHRTARFICVLALADAKGRIVFTVRDTMEGRLLRAPRGGNGFGYDPLFEVNGLGQTSAELPPGRKNALSHRGKALRRLRELMLSVPLSENTGGVQIEGRV